MAAYETGLRIFFPLTGEISAGGPNSYSSIANFIDDDDSSRASSATVNNNIDKIVTFTGFSDGLNPHSGAFTLYVDHQVDFTSGSWDLKFEYSVGGGPFQTYSQLTGETASRARELNAQVVNADVAQGTIQLRITFKPSFATGDVHRVFEVFAGEPIGAGMIF